MAIVDEDTFFEIELGWICREGIDNVYAPVGALFAPCEDCSQMSMVETLEARREKRDSTYQT